MRFVSLVVLIRLISGWQSPLVADDQLLSKTRAKLEAHEPVKIVCLGDSVTGVYYHTGGRRAYPEMIAIGLQKLDPHAKVTVINAGISGHSTDMGLKRLDKDVLDHRPDLVTVMFGLNDMTRIRKPEFRANLKATIERCRAAGAEVLLCTPNGVIDTGARPIPKLEEYNQAVKDVGAETKTPISDVYAGYLAVHAQDPLAFRLLCSDAVHPNMDGHKLNAETICRSITGREVSLSDVGPPLPAIPKTLQLLESNQPVRVLAMPPYDAWARDALRLLKSEARVDVTRWETEDKSLSELHAAAKTVRQMAPQPDLVILAIPLAVTPSMAELVEPEIVDHSWILNDTLSFGRQEWDVLVVAPSVLTPKLSADDESRDAFCRKMVAAQDLSVIIRPQEDLANAQTIFTRWFKNTRR